MRIIDQHHIELDGEQIALRIEPLGTPPPIVENSIDRPHQYALISDLLKAHTQVVIYGMPGSGKTTLAQQYAHNQLLSGGVLWVTVGPNFSTITSYTTMVDWMLAALDTERLPIGYEVESSHLQAVLAMLPPCLVVFDDVHHAHDIEDLRASLPHHAHVIITTRHQHIVNELGLHTIQISQFEPVQALALIANVLEQPIHIVEQWEWCHNLAAAVAFHPLAIRLVTRYLRQQSTNPHDWHGVAERIIHELPIDPWQELLENDTVSQGIQPLLARSFAVLAPMERQILYSIATCAPVSDISIAFIAHIWNLDTTQMRRAMQKLIDLSLIEPGYSIDSWRQHVVLRTYTLLQMAIHNAHDAILQTVIQRTTKWLNSHVEDYTFHALHDDYRHIEYLFGQALMYDPANAVAIAYNMRHYHDATGNYREQIKWSTQLRQYIEHNNYSELLVDAYILSAMDLFEVGIHTGEHRVEFYQQGYALFQHVNQLRAQLNQQDIDPQIANKFGIALQEYATLPNVHQLQILDDAVALYAHIRNAPGIEAGLYVSICQNYANTLAARAEYLHPNGAHDFETAIAACNEGLQWLPQTATSYHFIGLHMTKSSIYQRYSDIVVDRKAELLAAAYDSSSDALHYLNEADDPQRYAKFMMNRANLCSSFIDVPNVNHHKYLNQALECIHEALKYRTAERVPLEYSWTKHNQAHLLRCLATLDEADRHAMLRNALDTNREALRFRTKESVPEHFMRTQYQEAEICRDLADISQPNQRLTLLHHGLAACDQLLEVSVQFPDFWPAAASDLKSSLLYRLADVVPESTASLINHARAANDVALGIYAPTDHEDLTEVWLNRMHIEYIAYQHGIDAPTALKNLQYAAQTTLGHTKQAAIRAPLLAQIHIDIAALLLALPYTPYQYRQALELAQTGLTLAQSLHHSPLQLKAQHVIVQARKAQ
ncbi:MAG: NB-ARC domain-containing protein [Roseiflexaceae bacterium]